MAKFLDLEGVKTLWSKIKEKFASKTELDNKFDSLNGNYSNLESSVKTINDEVGRIGNQLDDYVIEEIKKLKIEVGALPSAEYINNQIRLIAPFTLTFSSELGASGDLNSCTKGAHVYNLGGKYTNSPLDNQSMFGSLINLVRYQENVYKNKEDVEYLYQFILLKDGRIFNRTRWFGDWNEWKEIERVTP